MEAILLLENPTRMYTDINGEFNRLAYRLVHDPVYADLYTVATDKLKAKQYVAAKIGGENVAQLYGYDEDRDKLMQRMDHDYMLKFSLNSGHNTIVRNGVMLQPDNMEPCISGWYFQQRNKPGTWLAEEILGENLHTYKFFCYRGKPLFVYYYYEDKLDDSKSVRTMVSYPDLKPTGWIDWYESKGEFRKSPHWNGVDWMARTLCEPFPIVRMDIFDTPRGAIFSEFTATFRSFNILPEADAAMMERIREHEVLSV